MSATKALITVIPRDGQFEARCGDLVVTGWSKADAKSALLREMKHRAENVDAELRRRLATSLEERVATHGAPLATIVAALDTGTLMAMQRSLRARLTEQYCNDHPDLAAAAMSQSTAIGLELVARDMRKAVLQ